LLQDRGAQRFKAGDEARNSRQELNELLLGQSPSEGVLQHFEIRITEPLKWRDIDRTEGGRPDENPRLETLRARYHFRTGSETTQLLFVFV
jgi:hypothetical protein